MVTFNARQYSQPWNKIIIFPCRLSDSSISFLIIPFWNDNIATRGYQGTFVESNSGDGKYREKYNAPRNGNSNATQTVCSFFLKCTTAAFRLETFSNQLPTKGSHHFYINVYNVAFIRPTSAILWRGRSNFRAFLLCSSLCTRSARDRQVLLIVFA